jgi:hypothetical protein
MPPETLGALRCPVCGNDVSEGGMIQYVETIENHRRVLRVENGALFVAGAYDTGEGYDDGVNPQFECHGRTSRGEWCGHRWPVQDWIARLIDWV